MGKSKDSKNNKLEIERAQILVSVNEAKDLVTSWLGSDYDINEKETIDIPVITTLGNAGLGYEDPNESNTMKSKALEKLKLMEKRKQNAQKRQDAEHVVKNGNNNSNVKSHDSDAESEEESRVRSIQANKNKKRSFDPVAAYKNKKKKKH